MKQLIDFNETFGSSISFKSIDAINEFTWTASKMEIVFLFKTEKTCLPVAMVFLLTTSCLTI